MLSPVSPILPRGFVHDDATRRFCTVLILSALDEARSTKKPLHKDQIHARYFLLARVNRTMVQRLIEAMGVDPLWFFGRVLVRLVRLGWPAPHTPPHSRRHPRGMYAFFTCEDAP